MKKEKYLIAKWFNFDFSKKEELWAYRKDQGAGYTQNTDHVMKFDTRKETIRYIENNRMYKDEPMTISQFKRILIKQALTTP